MRSKPKKKSFCFHICSRGRQLEPTPEQGATEPSAHNEGNQHTKTSPVGSHSKRKKTPTLGPRKALLVYELPSGITGAYWGAERAPTQRGPPNEARQRQQSGDDGPSAEICSPTNHPAGIGGAGAAKQRQHQREQQQWRGRTGERKPKQAFLPSVLLGQQTRVDPRSKPTRPGQKPGPVCKPKKHANVPPSEPLQRKRADESPNQRSQKATESPERRTSHRSTHSTQSASHSGIFFFYQRFPIPPTQQ